jgi:hypothetical protein
MAGPGGNYPPGSVIEADNAEELIKKGYAIKDGDASGNVLHDHGRKRGARQKN